VFVFTWTLTFVKSSHLFSVDVHRIGKDVCAGLAEAGSSSVTCDVRLTRACVKS